MKLHWSQYQKNYKQYILSLIDIEGTDQEKIDHLFKRFEKEKSYEIEKVGQFEAMINWLQGLSLTDLAIYSDEIIDLSIRMGSLDPNPSDKLRDKVIANYFRFMARRVLSLKK